MFRIVVARSSSAAAGQGLRDRSVAMPRAVYKMFGTKSKHKQRNVIAQFESYDEDYESKQKEAAEASDAANDSFARNKDLANIIREGMGSLMEGARAIQNDPKTKKGLFSNAAEKEMDPRVDIEQHRIFDTIQATLMDMVTVDPTHPLLFHGEEPVWIVAVRVTPARSYCDIYWSLPYLMLTSDELSKPQLEFLTDQVEERVLGAPGKQLLHQVYGRLKQTYIPRLRYNRAPPELLLEVMENFNS